MTKCARAFSIDHRSVRLFRFGLGIFILADLATRSPNFEAFHLESGLFPSRLTEHSFSIFSLYPSPYWTGLLFFVYGLLGIALIANYQPRVVSAICFVFALQLRARNSLLMYGADDLFRLGMLWSALLPSAKASETEKSFSNLLSIGALGQLFALYFCAGFSKSTNEWFTNPIATFAALSSDTYAKPIAQLFLPYDGLLVWSSRIVWLIERVGWVLFFSPWYHASTRMVAFVVFAGMHLMFGLFLHLELFPLMDVTMLALLLPSEFWDRLRVDDITKPASPPAYEPLLHKVAGVLIVLLLFLNISALPQIQRRVPTPVRRFSKAIGVYQAWSMFTPMPGISDGYYRLIGRTEGGALTDEFNRKLLQSWPMKPLDPQSEQGGFRWTRYLEELSVKNDPDINLAFIDYFCRKWTPPMENAEKREISLFHVHEATFAREIPVVTTMRTLATATCKP